MTRQSVMVQDKLTWTQGKVRGETTFRPDQAERVCDVQDRNGALTSELGVGLELDHQPSIFSDVDTDDLQSG